MKTSHKWIQILGEVLDRVSSLLKGQRPALQPVPIRVRPHRSPTDSSGAFS